MNRRGFLASMLFIPAAVKAVVTAPVRMVAVAVPGPDYVDIDAMMSEAYERRRQAGYNQIDVLTDRKTAEAIRETYRVYYAKKYGVVT